MKFRIDMDTNTQIRTGKMMFAFIIEDTDQQTIQVETMVQGDPVHSLDKGLQYLNSIVIAACTIFLNKLINFELTEQLPDLTKLLETNIKILGAQSPPTTAINSNSVNS